MSTPSHTALEVEVAVRLEGYRWVRWTDARVPEAPRDVPGRFLGPPRHLLSHLWLAASPEAPLSPQPFRHLPGYASDVADALRACEHAGLFRDGFAALTRHPSGVWRITIPGFARGLDHECLPVLLCRAGLVWSFLRGGPGATR